MEEGKNLTKNFTKVTAITFLTYFILSQMYYTQIYRFVEYYSGSIVFAISDGWAYLMQALGMIVMIVLFVKKPHTYGSKQFASITMVSTLPLLVLSVLAQNGIVLLVLMLILNFIIGFDLTFYYGLMTQYLPQKSRLMSIAVSGALGALAMWALSQASPDILTSKYIILIDAVLVAIDVYLFMSFESLSERCNMDAPATTNSLLTVVKDNKILVAVVFLMSALSVLGSSDNAALTADIGLSLLDVRALYGIGLIACALIYGKSKNAGALATMASLILPFIVLGMMHMNYVSVIVSLVTFIALGFYSVYKAGVFMEVTEEMNLAPVFAVLGLVASRLSDAITVTAFTLLYPAYYPVSFIVSGIIAIPLIILFYMLLTKNTATTVEDADSKKSRFGETYNLTRREEEVAYYIAQGKSNGEIASLTNLSESTVRFHVSNVLKKTELKTRNDVSRAYHRLQK